MLLFQENLPPSVSGTVPELGQEAPGLSVKSLIPRTCFSAPSDVFLVHNLPLDSLFLLSIQSNWEYSLPCPTYTAKCCGGKSLLRIEFNEAKL